jgi:hypothetical protein
MGSLTWIYAMPDLQLLWVAKRDVCKRCLAGAGQTHQGDQDIGFAYLVILLRHLSRLSRSIRMIHMKRYWESSRS